MDDTIETGFEDFEKALFADDYQTGSDDDTEETETTQNDDAEEATQDTEDEPDVSDDSDDEHTSDSEEESADGEDEANGGERKPGDDNPQMFTIKVNKKEEQVTLEQMTALAQQGRDYPRIKEQNQQLQQANTDLQSRLDSMAEHQEALDILGLLAERAGSSILDLTNTLYINFRKSGGASEDAAKLELENARLKKQSESAKTRADEAQEQERKNSSEERVQRDINEFIQENPGVELTNELLDKLAPDIHNGMSLAAAYRKFERAEEKARIAELERKIAAEKQNNKNKRNSPGSQKTSGGGNMDDVSIFEKALFG